MPEPVRIQKRRNPLAWPMLAVFAFLALAAFGAGHPILGVFLLVGGIAFLWVREDA